jgi:glycosyltransferase involved in cell wall biosynthesis
MKILIISKDFPNIVGGVSDYTYHLSKNLSKKKIDVYVLTSCNEKVIREIKGYNVKILPLIKKWGFSSISEIINEIQKINPEFILLQYTPYMYSHYGIPFWLIFLYFRLKFKRFKICTNFHEISILINLGDFKHLGIAISQRIIAYFISFLSDKIIVPIERWKKMLHFFKKKIEIIPVGSNIVPENDFKIDLSNKRNFIIVGSFGGANKSRRIEIHLKAVKILKEKGINVKYIFIGNVPDYFKKISRKLKIDAEFKGFLKSEEVYSILKSFDFFIFFDKYSNKYEGGINLKSGSVVAAFSANVPVISNSGFYTDKILKNLYIKSPPNPEDIANKIIEYLNNLKNIEKLKIKISEFYEKNLKWEEISNRYLISLKCQK